MIFKYKQLIKGTTLVLASSLLVACSTDDIAGPETTDEPSETVEAVEETNTDVGLSKEAILESLDRRLDEKLVVINGDYSVDEGDRPVDYEELEDAEDDEEDDEEFNEDEQAIWTRFETVRDFAKYLMMESHTIRRRLAEDNKFENVDDEYIALVDDFDRVVTEMGKETDEVLEVAAEQMEEDELERVLYDELHKRFAVYRLYFEAIEQAEIERDDGISDYEFLESNIVLIESNEQFVEMLNKHNINYEVYDFLSDFVDRVENQRVELDEILATEQ